MKNIHNGHAVLEATIPKDKTNAKNGKVIDLATSNTQSSIWVDRGPLNLNNYDIVAGKAVFNSRAARANESRISPDSDLYPPQHTLYIANAPVMSQGDLSLSIGKAKSRKTYFQILIIAAFIAKEIEQLKAIHYEGKTRVVWFDTEQSPYFVQSALKKALKLAVGPSGIEVEVHALRPFDWKERKQVIDYILNENNPENDVLLAVIDGIRDLVTDINDPEQATNLVSWVMKLTALKNMHITCVLHQNKGDQNARGHLGTEFTNKAETVFALERDTRDESVTWVKGEYTRNVPFDSFAFTINSDGLPEILPDYRPAPEKGKSAKPRPGNLQPETHTAIRDTIFSRQNSYGWSELCTQIKLGYEKEGITFGSNAARDYLAHWKNLGIIEVNKATQNGKKDLYYATNLVKT